jgi:hypothetical protein
MEKEKMLVRLRDVACVYASRIVTARDNYENVQRNYLKENAGKWIEIDTSHLFDNQYNSVDGIRIYDTMIDAVQNDARVGMAKCAYCGKIEQYTPENEENHAQCLIKMSEHVKKNYTHILTPFTPENTFFMQFPELPKITPIEEIRIGKAYMTLCSYADLNYYRVSNGRKCIDFIYDYDTDTFYVSNGIGYKRTKTLDVCDAYMRQIKNHLKAQRSVNV